MTTTPRTRLSPEQRREQLLDLGVRLLAHRSLDELSIDLLAEEAGISRGLLYHYFGNKHAFHEAVVRHAADDLIAQTAPPADGEPMERLLTSVTAYVDYVVANHEGYVSLVKAAAGGNETLRAIYEEARVGAQQPDLPRGRPGRDHPRHPAARLVVRGWSAMIEELVLSWIDDPAGVTRDELLAIIAASLPAVVEVIPARRDVHRRVAGHRPERDPAAVRGDDRLDQGQAEADAHLLTAGARSVAAGEPLEGVVDQVRREARAVVVDGEPVAAHRHRHRGAGRGVLAGVGQQVGDHLVQPQLVAGDDGGESTRSSGTSSRHRWSGADDPRVRDRLDEQPGQVDRLAFERPAGVQAGEQQQVLDQRRHPAGLLLDLVEGGAEHRRVVGSAAGQLGVAGDRRQRGAQLVARRRRRTAAPAARCGAGRPARSRRARAAC